VWAVLSKGPVVFCHGVVPHTYNWEGRKGIVSKSQVPGHKAIIWDARHWEHEMAEVTELCATASQRRLISRHSPPLECPFKCPLAQRTIGFSQVKPFNLWQAPEIPVSTIFSQDCSLCMLTQVLRVPFGVAPQLLTPLGIPGLLYRAGLSIQTPPYCSSPCDLLVGKSLSSLPVSFTYSSRLFISFSFNEYILYPWWELGSQSWADTVLVTFIRNVLNKWTLYCV
jgi:hypothetical protein